jgi:lipopolysaccharide export LptBFGC system permease protein LptF
MTALDTARPQRGARRFALVPLGTYTRTLVLAHARHVGTVTAALLVIAMTLDLAPRAEWIASQSPSRGAPALVLHFLWYLSLRMADLIGNLLPLACFMGLFWSEITLTQSRERVIIWNGGRSPLQTLVPLAILGIFFGALQVTALSVLRPGAVAIQMEQNLGEYGRRFDRRLHPQTRSWITLPNHLIQARIDFRASRLVDVQVFEFSDTGRLNGRIEAASAEPTATHGRWRFHAGSRWDAPDAASDSQPTDTGAARRFETEEDDLPLDPLWLANFGIDARYLPTGVLAALATRPDIPESSGYRTWRQVRFAQFFLPFGMLLLASCLATALIAQRTAFKPMILIGLAGYFLYVSNNIVVWLGEYGQVSAVPAAWLMPLVMVAAGLGLMTWLERRGRAS